MEGGQVRWLLMLAIQAGKREEEVKRVEMRW